LPLRPATLLFRGWLLCLILLLLRPATLPWLCLVLLRWRRFAVNTIEFQFQFRKRVLLRLLPGIGLLCLLPLYILRRPLLRLLLLWILRRSLLRRLRLLRKPWLLRLASLSGLLRLAPLSGLLRPTPLPGLLRLLLL